MSSIPFILRSDTLTTPAIRPSPYIHISSRIFGHRGDRSEHQAADPMLPAPAFARTRAGVFTRKFHRPFRSSTNQPHFQPFGYFNRLLPLFPDPSGSRLHALFGIPSRFRPLPADGARVIPARQASVAACGSHVLFRAICFAPPLSCWRFPPSSSASPQRNRSVPQVSLQNKTDIPDPRNAGTFCASR